jgi:hypothetical protein
MPRPMSPATPSGSWAAASSADAATLFLGEYKRLGLQHVLLEFRRDDLGRMLEILDLVASRVRPAVDAA